METLAGVLRTRESCGTVDLAQRGRMVIAGKDHLRFLQGMVSNDVQQLVAGQGCHALKLSSKGRIVGDLTLYRDADQMFCECDPGPGDAVKQALEHYVVMDEVTIETVSDQQMGEIGVFGPRSAELLGAVGIAVPELLPFAHVQLERLRVAGNSELGLPGYHIFGARADLEPLGRALASQGATTLSQDELEALRIEAGRTRFGKDFDADMLPMEANLDDAIPFTKGCYVGQEVIVRATSRGAVKHKIMGLVVEGDEVPAPRLEVTSEARPVAGHITSATYSPTLGRVVALAYLWREVWEPGTQVKIKWPDGREVAATVAKLPFVAVKESA